ncbi:winged helix-turn-helix domain-containing protein [Salinicola sp. CPA57]|uniref:winged helix-turn-helix domain-containing protein n=1 Tax=Salinicola sp. CPA57 TaxID=1949080 RepID=UPI000DA2025E|nr:winged helix-turn-helix domain-containing protein [Salinicola sp. CPA57]
MTRTHHPTPRLQIRLVADTEIVLGPGKIELLEAIERHGSIAAACRDMGLSYKKAWQLLDTMNRHLAAPVVNTASGGTQRGGATLTDLGRRLIVHYRQLTADLARNPSGQALLKSLSPDREYASSSHAGSASEPEAEPAPGSGIESD